MSSFEGRAIQIMGDMVQITDEIGGHSIFLSLAEIIGGRDLRLRDRVRVEGPETDRRGRRLAENTAGVAEPSLA
ncbi:MAG: hypothetical protein ACOCYE_14120 [Pseudomonadota bacterium]